MLKTLFVISITTARIVFPDIPILQDLQPGEVSKDVPTYSKSVSMTLTSPKYTDGIPSVRVDVPSGLGVGESVKLIVHNPKPALADAKGQPAAKTMIGKTYWGCGEKIVPGQPKVEELKDSADDEMKLSHAFWPIGYYKEKVAGPNSKAAGRYTLTSNYCGGTSVSVDADQAYLEPITLTGLKGKVDPSKPLVVRWTRVQNAVGYVVNLFGGNDKETITWTSGSDPSLTTEIEDTPIAAENVKTYLDKKILLPPDATVCTIPAGVLKGIDNAVVTVVAVGKDRIQPGEDMDSQVLVRSIASIPLAIDVPIPAPTP